MVGFTQTLQTYSGASATLLNSQEVSDATRKSYARFGFLMFFVVMISASVAAFSWGSVFKSYYVAGFVFVTWFCISSGMNALFCYGMDSLHGASFGKRLRYILALLVFNMLISWLNTTFVLMLTMDQEITAKIETDYRYKRSTIENEMQAAHTKYVDDDAKRRAKAKEDIATLETQAGASLTPLRKSYETLQSAYQTQYNEYAGEVAGRVGSKLQGDGPAAKAKKAQVDATEKQMNDAKERLDIATAAVSKTLDTQIKDIKEVEAADLKRLESAYAGVQKGFERNLTELDSTPRTGFIHRHLALLSLIVVDPTGMLMFFVFFFFLESVVIILKLITPENEYQVIRAHQTALHSEAAGRNAIANAKAHREQLLANANEELEAQRQLRELRAQQHREEAQAAADAVREDQARVNALRAEGTDESSVVSLEKALAEKRKKM